MAKDPPVPAVPAHEMSRECANLLLTAMDSGRAYSEARLREELGVGHDDLMLILDQLRENGQAVQTAPGEWSGPATGSAAPDEGRVVVDVPGEEAEGRPEGLTPEMVGAAWDAGRSRIELLGSDATVRLTRSIADALDAAAVGQIVKAGLDGVPSEDVFTLEVVP